MTNLEFMLEIIRRAAETRRELCGIHKTKILAQAQIQMCDEEIRCLERLIELERRAEDLRLRAAGETGVPNPLQPVVDLWGVDQFEKRAEPDPNQDSGGPK